MAEDYAAPDWRGLCSRMADALDHNRQCLLDDRSLTHPLADKARAALARWGRSAPAPAEREVAELVTWLRNMAEAGLGGLDELNASRAADLLERQAAPVPVAVSERLPGPEDCDGDERCWLLVPRWILPPFELTHWLPATALPLPQGDVE